MRKVTTIVSSRNKIPRMMIGVDLSWILHKNYNAIRVSAIVEGREQPTGHMFGTSRLAQSLISQFPEAAIIFCVDSDPVHKSELLSSYKAGRERKFDRVQASIDICGIITSYSRLE